MQKRRFAEKNHREMKENRRPNNAPSIIKNREMKKKNTPIIIIKYYLSEAETNKSSNE